MPRNRYLLRCTPSSHEISLCKAVRRVSDKGLHHSHVHKNAKDFKYQIHKIAPRNPEISGNQN